MADAAAFFAKKKKGKKKAFKFNANNIDASAVTQTVHVDAPALSTDQDSGPAGITMSAQGSSVTVDPSGGENDKGLSEQWDDEALAATFTRKAATAAPGGGTTTELMDMKAFDPMRFEQNDIVEKLRLEENKAKLAAAREGMEREAQRMKEEHERKRGAAVAAAVPRYGTTAVYGRGGGGCGGKWIPPHMRAGGAGMMPKIRVGATVGGMTSKVDTQDESSFPDLAAADAIIEQQQKHQQPAYKMAKKTPVGGGASWAATPTSSEKKPELKGSEAAVREASQRSGATLPSQGPVQAISAEKPRPITPPLESSSLAIKSVGKPLGKKKKKDVSTFKG